MQYVILFSFHYVFYIRNRNCYEQSLYHKADVSLTWGRSVWRDNHLFNCQCWWCATSTVFISHPIPTWRTEYWAPSKRNVVDMLMCSLYDTCYLYDKLRAHKICHLRCEKFLKKITPQQLWLQYVNTSFLKWTPVYSIRFVTCIRRHFSNSWLYIFSNNLNESSSLVYF